MRVLRVCVEVVGAVQFYQGPVYTYFSFESLFYKANIIFMNFALYVISKIEINLCMALQLLYTLFVHSWLNVAYTKLRNPNA